MRGTPIKGRNRKEEDKHVKGIKISFFHFIPLTVPHRGREGNNQYDQRPEIAWNRIFVFGGGSRYHLSFGLPLEKNMQQGKLQNEFMNVRI